MRAFVKLPYELYRNDPLWIPQLLMQEKAQFDRRKNPAFGYCEAEYFLATRDGKTVGRTAAIINNRYLEKLDRKCGRFGWFECENNPETADALLLAAENWLLERGMEEISGPMGFTDNDMIGFLVEGFNELPTIAGSYNPPCYNDFVTRRGYEKEVDYVEFRLTAPEAVAREGHEAGGDSEEANFDQGVSTRLQEGSSPENGGTRFFDVLNAAYAELRGTTLLDEKEIEYYIDTYLGHVDPEIQSNWLQMAIVSLDSSSPCRTFPKAFQKARGHLFSLRLHPYLPGYEAEQGS